MVTATCSMATRSSLELMLDKLQQIQERPDEVPPALPARPVSKARLPRSRLPLQLRMDFGERDRECVSVNVNVVGFERENKQDFADRHSNGVDASSAQFLKKSQEKGICKIQKCYRGHKVRCCYKQLTMEVIALQSFIRGENARKGYEQRCRIHRAIIIIQKQGRKYIEHLKQLHSGSLDGRHPSQIEDETRVVPFPYTSLVDLQKRVVRTEAKLRAKKEENVVLKNKLLEMEKKWHTCEERMTSMEKEWQDQLTYIQECLAAAKKNPSPSSQTRFSNRFQNPDCWSVKSGIPKGRRLYNIQMNSNNNGVDEEVNEDGEEQVCLKLRPHEEIRKLKMRFKEWKKEYKNKLRDAQSTFNKLGNAESSKSHKNWWGR